MKVQEGGGGVSFRRPSFPWKHLAVEDIFKGRWSQEEKLSDKSCVSERLVEIQYRVLWTSAKCCFCLVCSY